jgi:hypothetical protein
VKSIRFVVGLLLLVGAAGCSNQGNSGPSFNFSRPELLSFLCMAPRIDAPKEYVPIPRACCAVEDPSRVDGQAGALPANAPQCTLSDPQGNNPQLDQRRVLHALVSQSARGEIAAVDLLDKDVLDSDRIVPGATFINAGGLPVALVTPVRQPRSSAELGPQWTYVASAEELQVRAIANCRFRSGTHCGPERAEVHRDQATLERHTRIALPAAPGDMVLAPASLPDRSLDEALWVTLPDQGLIARIELSGDPNLPFALEGDVPAQPRFYPVPAPALVEAPLPVAEQLEYVAACGLGAEYVPASQPRPLAPRARPTAAVRPTRLRFDPESGLLLVADGVAPVLHVFAVAAEGALTPLAALPTGVPLRDFVLTPRVPPNAPALELLRDPRSGVPAVPPADAPARRYLYAIEERGDGLVLLFDFAVDAPGAQPRLTPLLAPVPEERYADRIKLRAPAVALSVIDTRDRSAYVCGVDEDGALKEALSHKGEVNADLASIARADERLDISEDAESGQLRGVFLVVASADGELTVVDVQDLDLGCRARDECKAEDLLQPIHPDSQDALAVRRHAPRRRAAGEVTATVSGSGTTLAEQQCTGASRPAPPPSNAPPVASVNALVCVAKDPWSTLNENWTIRHRGAFSAMQSGAFEFPNAPFNPREAQVSVPAEGQIALHAPEGMSLCATGVMVGDLVAVVGAPAERASGCEAPTASDPTLLAVRAAFDDGLVLELAPDDDGTPASPAVYDDLRRCYPDFVGVELRARDYLVTGATTLLHRVVSAADGRCVIDETKDPRLTSRPVMLPQTDAMSAEGDYRFENPYLSFTIRARDASDARTVRDATVQTRNAATPLTLNNADGRISDALPVSMSYLPEVGDLFVVDTASQGLRRYGLRPFEWDDRSIYR